MPMMTFITTARKVSTATMALNLTKMMDVIMIGGTNEIDDEGNDADDGDDHDGADDDDDDAEDGTGYGDGDNGDVDDGDADGVVMMVMAMITTPVSYTHLTLPTILLV
eukprot:2512806-Pyramimonas_sp.AAC.1